MRVGVLGLLHESNTFVGDSTTIEHFQHDTLLSGEAVRVHFRDTRHEIGGFFAALAEAGMESVPVFAARAMPSGIVTTEALDHLLDRMFDQLGKVGQLEGLLVAPHGAMVSAAHADADGYWLARLRDYVGPGVPIIGTLDLHANLSEAMVDACDALVAYRTNPHLDQRDRGTEAAQLLARTLRGEVRPTQAAAMPPLAIDIECQLTAKPPCLPVYEMASQLRGDPRVLSTSILLGFPYADVRQMGCAAICVTDDDPRLAGELSRRLAEHLWSARRDMIGTHLGIDEALDQALQLAGPVCLLDMGDNVGGGSPADGTHLAHALARRRVGRSFVCLYDPQSVRQARQAGLGDRVTLHLGGKTDHLHGRPLEADCTIKSFHDGCFEELETRHGGMKSFDQGSTAVVQTDDDLTVMLTSRRMVPFSLRQLTSCGLAPASYAILVAKGVNAPVAAYREVCQHFIQVNTPGVTRADMTQLTYRSRRRPMFPFEPDTKWIPK